MRRTTKGQGIILGLLLGGLILRLGLSFFGTLNLDHGTFVAWGNLLVRDGFKNFYNSWSDYLPGYPYFLWLLSKIDLLGIVPEVVLYKLPAILADLATGFLIYKILERSKGQKWGLIGTAIYIFNPAIIYNSALWGQVDSLTALTSILAIYLLPENIYLSAISLAIGTLIKPQTAFIFPVVIFMMLKNKNNIPDILKYCLTGLFVFILGFVPFWNHTTLPFFIYERLGVSLNQYPYTSVNAFNFWGIVGFWKPDNIFYQVGGYLLVLSTTIFLCFKLLKTKNSAYFLVSFVFGASFMFFTRMHERHLLPVFAPLAVAAIENPILLIPYIGFSLTYVANLYYAFIWVSNNFREAFSDMFVKLLEVLNIGLIIFVFYTLAFNLKTEWKKISQLISRFVSNEKTKIVEYKFPKIKLSKDNIKIILYLILAFAFLIRVFNLNSPSTMYFDEVYHAFTAKVIMSSDAAKAWEWWNTPPAGFAYEWTHPPLAKLGMVLGMLLFGQNSFGWRIPGALLGVGSVYLVYLLARQIFNDEGIGLLSAGAFSLDGLALVMSRIGMNDSYIIFFMLLSVYLFLKQKDFLSSIAFGLAIASKWSAIWAIPILAIIYLQRNPLKIKPIKILKTFIYFLIIPFSLYLLSYFDMFLTGHNLTIWWGMQQQMWWYHTGLKATHPYSSMWWSWPFLIRPIYLYTSDEIGGMVSRIYAFGNPAVFWFGCISVIMSAVYAFIEKNKKLGLVVFAYLMSFIGWASSPRIMFLYHYLPAIPFMCILIGYVLRRNPKIILPFFIFASVLFVYFFPHYIGLRIPLWLDQGYYWFTSWR